MIVLIAYCFIGFTAIGLSPLPLENPKTDIDRYDIQLRWDEQFSNYKISTKYNKPICCSKNSFVSADGEADKDFRDLISNLLIDIQEDTEKERDATLSFISSDDAKRLIDKLAGFNSHELSIGIIGGELNNKSIIGANNYTILGDGPVDFWTIMIRDYVWIPLNIDVDIQWIFLGVMVGAVMGTIVSQSRSIISMIIPKKQSAEFFGFFSFIMKAAAMIGPLIFGFCVSLYDDRVGLLSIIVVIFLGTVVFYFFDLEKGIEEAKLADSEN